MLVAQLATKYQISEQAVTSMLQAVNNGNGSMAQFNIPELGGMGQWMRGGMTMVGDMFNQGLQLRVSQLCQDLANALAQQTLIETPPPYQPNPSQQQTWWPSDWGFPASQGGQNNSEYAFFPGMRRLAVRINGVVSLYDTSQYNIGGFSQQQPSGNLLMSTSQGTIGLAQLIRI